MSASAIGWALEQELTDPLLKLTLIVLADRQPVDYYIVVEPETIAAESCTSYIEIIDTLDELEALGLLDWSFQDTRSHAPVGITLIRNDELVVEKASEDALIYVFEQEEHHGSRSSKYGITRDLNRRFKALDREGDLPWRLHAAWRMRSVDALQVFGMMRAIAPTNDFPRAGLGRSAADFVSMIEKCIKDIENIHPGRVLVQRPTCLNSHTGGLSGGVV